MKHALVSGDWHVESNTYFQQHHDPRAIDIFIKVCKWEKPDLIVLNGDILGCSVHSKHDTFDKADWTEDKRIIKGYLKKLSKIGCEIKWLEGNHEWWFTKYLMKNAKTIYDDNLANGLAHMDRELDLGDLGVEYIPYAGDTQPSIQLGSLRVYHGDAANKHAGATAKNIMSNVGSSFLVGHVHRMAMTPKTMGFPGARKTHVGYENGCLCNLDVVFGGKASAFDWQQGFSEVIYEDRPKGFFSVNQRIITNGKVIHNGRLYKA